MWCKYNPNPLSVTVGDCSVRALCKALDKPWEEVYTEIVLQGFMMCDMPSSNAVWGAVLRKHGYSREALPTDCPECYTAEEFAVDHPKGTYVLSFSGHVATVVDGNLYDAWNSSKEIPQYYWHRKE